MHRPAEIDGDHAIHVVGRVLHERLDVVPAGGIDQKIDAPMARDHVGGAAPRRLRIGEVDGDRLDREPGIGCLLGHLARLSPR